jgi:hypothetical protein
MANGSRRLSNPADNTGMCGGAACTADEVVAGGVTTITIPVQVDGVATNCVLSADATTSAAARTFHCDGLTEAACGANVVTAASTVSPCSLMTVTAANNVVSFARKSGSTSYLGRVVIAVAAGSNLVVENGTDGALNIPQVRVVAGANTACTTTCGANRGCLFGQNTAALTYAIVDCSDATADICVCLGGL